MPDAATLPVSLLAAFRSRDFRSYQLSALLSTISMQMQSVAVGWQVYALTGQAIDLGYVGLAQFLPAIALSAVTGPVAVRYDRRQILIVCHGLLLLSAALLFTLAQQARPSTALIYVVLTLVGTARAFQGPAGQALLPNLVPLHVFPNAVAWSSSSWQIAVVAGPALGGFLYAVNGGNTVYGAAIGLELVTVLVLFTIRARASATAKYAATWHDVSAGLRFVWTNPVILGAISLDLFAVLFGGAVALLPIYARDILREGPTGLGLLRSAPAVGALVVGVWLAYRPLRARAGAVMLSCVGLFGLGTIAFGLSRSFGLSLVALAATGAVDMVSVFIRHSLVQLRTPDAMRGRVAAVNMIFIGASNELGEFESGLAAEWLGAVPAVVLGGCATCLIVVLWARWFPALRRIDRLDTAHDPSPTG